MKLTVTISGITFLVFLGVVSLTLRAQQNDPTNPVIDYQGFLQDAREAGRLRAERRLSEQEFIRMSREPGTIILDTRSRQKFLEMHIAGAVHVDFSDITRETLQETIPSQSTRVLIYCNNNFLNSPGPFPVKLARAALNIPTFITLYIYGYRNLYELGPVIDFSKSRLRFEEGE